MTERWEFVPKGLNDNSGRQMFPPDGLYVVRNGVAVAVTAEEMQAAATETHAFCCIPGPAVFQKLIAALTRPADGASE